MSSFSRCAMLFVLLAWGVEATAAELAPHLPRGIVPEQTPTEAGQTKIVFVAGSNFFKPGEHEYLGGCAVLMNLVRQTPKTFPVLAVDWPTKRETFADAKAIVLFCDGGDKHPILNESRLAELNALAEAGVGFTFLHQGVDVPKSLGDDMRRFMGAAFEKGYSKRAHWVDQFKTFPDHAICRGVTPFTIDDGYLYQLRFVDGHKGVTPLLSTLSPKPEQRPATDADGVVAWAYERAGRGRSFAFTGGHLHRSLAEEGYRRFLVNGILWTAGVEVPTSGAPVALDVNKLGDYLATPTTSPAGK